MPNLFEFVGRVSSFGFRVIGDAIRIPLEGTQILSHIIEAGYKSLPLVVPAGFALGTVMTLHTRNTLVTFGAGDDPHCPGTRLHCRDRSACRGPPAGRASWVRVRSGA